MEPQENNKKGVGPIIGSIIIILVIAIGGIYYLKNTKDKITENKPIDNSTTTLGTSTEISDIQNDLDGTDVDNLDKELIDIESEIDAALKEI